MGRATDSLAGEAETPEGQENADWWRAAFAAGYMDVYAHRDDRSARQEIAGLGARLRQAPGPILDACCGGGRHLQALRELGLQAVGFDWSGQLLAAAAARSLVAGRLVRGDVRQPPFAGGFGAVLLLFTAFGYFGDAADQQCLVALAQLLAKGGWLVVDLPDGERVRAALVPSSIKILPDGSQVVEQRRLEGDQVVKDVRIERPSGPPTIWQERVRLYRDDEIRALASSGGLRAVETWASLRGPELDDGRRVWWLQRR